MAITVTARLEGQSASTVTTRRGWWSRIRSLRLWQGLLLLAAVFLGMRAMILGMSEYYVQVGDEQSAERALTWTEDYPPAESGLGNLRVASDPEGAEALLLAAIRGNPADASAYVGLALAREKKAAEEAGKLAALSAALAPRRADIQQEVAAFWMRQERADRALVHWSEALRTQPRLGEQFYPQMMQLAANPALWPAYKEVLARDPPWWPGFIRYVAANAEKTDVLRVLHQLRRESGMLPETDERKALLSRLQREGQWTDAYFYWLNGLDKTRMAVLGNVYNGSFELPLSGEGFDWIAPKVPAVVVEAIPTFGATGTRALHVQFQGGRTRFQHVSQFLMLEPGRYRLIGRARPDGLEAEKGVQWTVRCTGSGALLGESERFLGSDQWRYFSAEFRVPAEDCEAQLLRLELVGQLEFELQAKGGVWFDDLAVILYEEPKEGP